MKQSNQTGDRAPCEGSSVGRIGLGLAALGRPTYLTAGRSDALGAPVDRTMETMRTRTFEVLDAAWQLGIRFLDLAPSYGHAEDFLGAWLAAHPTRRAQLTISSKWGYEYVARWKLEARVHERKEHSLAMLDKQWPATQSALGGAPDFYLAVQTTWNILERSAQGSLAVAAENGWMVIVKEAMANGRLAPGGTPEADRLATTGGITSDALAIGAALAQDWAHIVLSGAVTVAQLTSNTQARALHVDPDEFDHLSIPADRYWAERAEREWS